MKTITISIDDETYRHCQVIAEAAGVSLEEWTSERLAELVPKSIPKGAGKRSQLKRQEIIERIRSESPGFSAAARLPREELYDRDASR